MKYMIEYRGPALKRIAMLQCIEEEFGPAKEERVSPEPASTWEWEDLMVERKDAENPILTIYTAKTERGRDFLRKTQPKDCGKHLIRSLEQRYNSKERYEYCLREISVLEKKIKEFQPWKEEDAYPREAHDDLQKTLIDHLAAIKREVERFERGEPFVFPKQKESQVIIEVE